MEQAEVFEYVIRTLERLNIVYMVVGSCASMSYGEPRMTQDIDIVISADAGQLATLCAAFPSPEFYVSIDAAMSALRLGSQFNVIHPDSGNKIDFVIGKDDAWSIEQLARRQKVRLFPGVEGYAARPEDIIIGKLIFYDEGGSDKHVRDIAGMLRISGVEIDRDYVNRWAADRGLTEIWKAVVKRADAAGS